MKKIQIKRIYVDAEDEDGYRILVDRSWPRGIKKEYAKLDEWNKDIPPSDDLRKWFDHQPERFKEFEKKISHGAYQKERGSSQSKGYCEAHKSYASLWCKRPSY